MRHNNVLKNHGYNVEHNVETKFPTGTAKTTRTGYFAFSIFWHFCSTASSGPLTMITVKPVTLSAGKLIFFGACAMKQTALSTKTGFHCSLRSQAALLMVEIGIADLLLPIGCAFSKKIVY
jgi:hypothetical protein